MFAYNVSTSYYRLKIFIQGGLFEDYFKNFEPFRILWIYPKDDDSEKCFVFTDKELFGKHFIWEHSDWFSSMSQEDVDKVALNINKYLTEGDISILGGNNWPPTPERLN
jgi:hypothetical protein